MNRKLSIKISLVTMVIFTALLAGSGAFAFDHLEITVVNPHLVAGHPAVTVETDFSVNVRAVNADGSTDVTANFIHAQLQSPDVAAVLPGNQYLTNGEYQFDGLRFLADGQPVRLRVFDFDDGSVPVAEVEINCYNYVDHFDFSVPAGDKFVNQAVNIAISARDAAGVAVLNFRDDIDLTALVGNFPSGPVLGVSGLDFSLGAATVPVTFWGTDPVTRENALTATNSVVYPGQATPASGSATITPLRPGPLDDVMLLLPGESLTPGVSPGKSGEPNSQTSGMNFGGISVYATDQHWNPIEPAALPNLTWTSDDPNGGVILPATGVMGGNPESSLTSTLIRSGTTRMTVTASGAVSATSRSDLIINPQGLDHFEFDAGVWNPADPQVTTIPFNIRIYARDSNDNTFPLNGVVSLRVRIGTTDESADYILTNNATFVDGQLDALVQVTKRGFSAYLIVDSGVVGESGAFQVNAGPAEKILISFPGETWVNGLNDVNFSGNQGTPNAVTAGDIIDPVTIRPVDRYNNLAPGNRNVTLSCPSGYFELPDYPGNVVTINNPTDIRVTLRSADQLQFLRAESSGISASDSSPIIVSPDAYAHLVVEAPGETLDPGIFDSIADDGKVGDPSIQDAGVPFDVRVYATDAYWNPVMDVDPVLPLSMDFSSSDGAAALPANPQSISDNNGEFAVTLITLADPNHQTVRVDDNGSGVFAFTTVPMKAGVVDHFDIGINSRTNPTPADALTPLPDHRAGSLLPNVTIIARDIFDNHVADYTENVTLYVSHGTGILNPLAADMGAGFGNGAYQGAWRGNIQITRTGTDVRFFVREDTYAHTDSSNTFNVFATAQDYADLIMLLPGETATPGIAPGKVGDPLPLIAGDPVVASIIATDAWWNQVPVQPQVHFTSNNYFQMITPNDTALDPDGTAQFDLFLKTAAVHDLTAADLITPAINDVSQVLVESGDFSRLMLLLPGEAAEPGGPEADGKTGSPLPQTASLEFDARIRAVDQFWNQVDDSSEHVWLASDDGSISPTNPLNNGQALVSGEITMPVFLTSTGFVTLAGTALDHTDLTGQQATVEIQQGASYQIVTPETAFVGPPQTFSVTVSLVDENGDPMPTANNWFNIQALRSNLEPASSNLLITSSQLSGGNVVIAGQAYDTVEDIVLWITDTAGRSSYSSTIRMQPNGLEYVVSMDAAEAPLVGPPATFPIGVMLRDTDTHTIVDEDRNLDVAVMSALGGPGLGVAGVLNQRLDHGVISFQQSYTRAENIYVTVTDSTGLSGSSPVFAILADGYKRLQIVAPGEIVEAGIPEFDATGKSGDPLVQRSGELFPMTVRAVDQYWNLADTTNAGNLRLVASDNSFAAPGNPQENYVPFVNGRRTFNGYLTDEGTVAVTAYDEDDLAKPSQSSYIPVDPPYEYEITVPATASTGPVPGFQITVKLIDPITGNVVPTTMNRFYLTPLLPNQGAASGELSLIESQLVGGVSVINNQSYSTVEDIIVRVTDDFGREAFSSVIVMDSGGLYFSVSIPDSATVGPPTTFPLVVELLDSNTGERVITQDRLFNLRIVSAQTGLAGAGFTEVTQGILSAGIRTIAQAYSRAEEIFVEVSDSTGIVGISNTCRMQADGFKRIQIVAPGETPVPGALSGDGKDGEPLTQQAETPFTVSVRAVDQYWNMAHTVSDGTIHLSSSGGELDLVDAAADNAPFVNGSRDIEIVLGNPGLVSVFATDAEHATVNSGRVDIPVNEAEYQIVLPDPATVTAGPPATFALTVRLVNPETGERIDAGGDFTMTALLPSRQASHDTLGITAGTLVGGEAVISGQHYATSEQIVIRVRDERGRESFSDVLTVVPEGVRYAVDIPDTVVAGQPFAMAVRRVDIVTGQLVTTDDRNFSIRVFSGNSPRPDFNLSPAGILADSVGTTYDGEHEFSSQTYDRAESIYLRISDSTGEQFFSDVVVVIPAPAAVIELWAEDIPGHVLDRPLRPDEAVIIRTRATDATGNPVQGSLINLAVIEGDGRLGNTRSASTSFVANVNGEASSDLSVDHYGRVDILLQAASGDIDSDGLLLEVVGPPESRLTFAPEASPFREGFYITGNTEMSLSAVTEDLGGIQAIFFDVDLQDPPRPVDVYTGTFSLADLGVAFTTPGLHTLRFYAEEGSGVIEEVHTVSLYTANALDMAKEITNRPNPFNPNEGPTMIMFRPTASGNATVTIYDLYGDVVHSEQHFVTAGEVFQMAWDGTNSKGRKVANGGYICRVHGNNMDLRRKIAVVK
jgi:FlgD Ig-like domain